MSDARSDLADLLGASVPSTWDVAWLADAVQFTKKPRAVDGLDEIAFIPMGLISERTLAIPEWELRPRTSAKSGTYFEAGDVLLSRITPCFENGKLGVAPDVPGGWGMATTEVYALRAGALEPRFLAYYLKLDVVRERLKGTMEGATGRMRVPKAAVEALPVPIPPRDEQEDVVVRIEELLARTGKASEVVRATDQNLNVLRRSCLKAWLGTNDLPEAENKEPGTTFVQLADLCLAIVDCEHKTAPRDPEGEAFSVGTGNLRNGQMNLDDAKRVSEATFETWSRRATLQARDIVLAREAPVGEVGMVPPGVKVCLGQRTVLIRADETKVQAEYLLYLLQGPELRSQMAALSAGSTVEHLNVGDIRRLKVPLPPSLEEQERMVERIDTSVQQVGAGFAALQQVHGLAAALDRSILRSAFSGHFPVARTSLEPASAG